jgi:MFS family permease
MFPRNILRARVPIKDLAPAIVLVFNSLVWYTLTYATLISAVENLELTTTETFILFGVYYCGALVAALVGAWLLPRWQDRGLLLWMLFGTIMTALLSGFQNYDLLVNLLLSLFLGISIGIGLPSSLAYFADTTAVDNRGTYGGITWSTVGFGILALALALSELDLVWTYFALAIWRVAGLVIFFALSKLRGKRESSPVTTTSYRAILGRKEVTLFLLPWIMFSLINFAEEPILGNLFGELQVLIGFVEFAITGVFAIVGGILADLVGRKRVVITGFVILGIEYAVLSLFSSTIASWYVYTVCDGIAWGMFAAVFFMTLWGDLAENNQKEKYYVLGGMPYLLAGFLPVLVKPFVGGIQTATAFSLASFFLFLAVLPLMYAPETLPEKKIKERELGEYVERAKKTKEKYA